MDVIAGDFAHVTVGGEVGVRSDDISLNGGTLHGGIGFKSMNNNCEVSLLDQVIFNWGRGVVSFFLMRESFLCEEISNVVVIEDLFVSFSFSFSSLFALASVSMSHMRFAANFQIRSIGGTAVRFLESVFSEVDLHNSDGEGLTGSGSEGSADIKGAGCLRSTQDSF